MDLHELASLYSKSQRLSHRTTYPAKPSPLTSTRLTSVFSRLGPKPSTARSLLERLAASSVKPRVFISYHHAGDQYWQYRFARYFGNEYELFTDRSIYRQIGSDDPTYQSRKIREEHISGSSLTIILIGANTWRRKHVDWEIHSTLAKRHGLLGIILPTCLPDRGGWIPAPRRFVKNINTGFATCIRWSNDPATMRRAIAVAQRLANTTESIDNSLPQMARNLS